MNYRYPQNEIGRPFLPLVGALVWWATAMAVVVLGRLGPAFALAPDFSVDRPLDLNTEITCMLQDRDGFLWIGTNGKGVARYDAYQVRYYRGTEFGVDFNYIVSMLEDRTGRLWFLDRGQGLIAYDKATGRFRQHRHIPGNANSLSADTTGENNHLLAQGPEGKIWTGPIRESGRRQSLDDPRRWPRESLDSHQRRYQPSG